MGLSFAAPHAGRDHAVALGEQVVIISIHAPLAGRDLKRLLRLASLAQFQSTRPLRGATHGLCRAAWNRNISIHAPLAGRDNDVSEMIRMVNISIHAPLAGRDVIDPLVLNAVKLFQSTRPLRGATWTRALWPRRARFQSTRPLRGATTATAPELEDVLFQSTRPLRGATAPAVAVEAPEEISIHAPLAGRDTDVPAWAQDTVQNFNPRAPCGARPVHLGAAEHMAKISIHAPLAGRDLFLWGLQVS